MSDLTACWRFAQNPETPDLCLRCGESRFWHSDLAQTRFKVSDLVSAYYRSWETRQNPSAFIVSSDLYAYLRSLVPLAEKSSGDVARFMGCPLVVDSNMPEGFILILKPKNEA